MHTLVSLSQFNVPSFQVFIYIQSVSAYLAPPIVAVYFAGVLWCAHMSQVAHVWLVVYHTHHPVQLEWHAPHL